MLIIYNFTVTLEQAHLLSVKRKMGGQSGGVEGNISQGMRQRTYNAHAEYGYSLKEIGDHLGVHYATVSKMVKRAQQGKWQGKT